VVKVPDKEPGAYPLLGEASVPTPWRRAREHLERSTATYWLVTDARPHVRPTPRFSCRLGLDDANETKPPRVPRAGAPLLRWVRADDLHVVPSGVSDERGEVDGVAF
jgi:hypothetical protein